MNKKDHNHIHKEHNEEHNTHKNHNHDQHEHSHKHSHDHSGEENKEHHNHHNHDHHNHEDHKGHSCHDLSNTDHHKMMIEDYKKRFYLSLILTIPVLILSPLIQSFLNFSFTFTGDKYVLFLFSSIIFFYGGWPFLKGLYDEVSNKNPGMMTLIAIAITVAYVYSSAVVFGLKGKYFFWELATLIDVMLLGHWIEMKSVLGASKALEKLAQLLPDKAHLVVDEKIVDVKLSDLKKDDVVLVKAGEKIPSDGIIIEGESFIDESMLTGESKPVLKKVSDKVIGGSINGNGILKVKVTNTGEESYLNKVINLVKEAQSSKSKTEKLADVAAKWLTYIAVTSGIITFSYWSFYSSLEFAIERMVTVMVIACPHALGLAIPLVNSVSTSIAAKNGILIRNRTAFENSKKVSVVLFDKTGTLTEGKFKVSSIKILDDSFDEKRILELAVALEKNSEHPIAKGILDKAEEYNIRHLKAKSVEILRGEGLKGIVDGKKIILASQKYLSKNDFEIPNISFDFIGTLVYVVVENKIVAALTLEDSIREESYSAIKKLKSLGIKTYMLTGDHKKIAEKVAEKLSLDGFYAELLPHEKLDIVKELQSKGEYVSMVGDGINDAPALAQSNLGIAIGSGTDIAAETADVILVNDNPETVYSVITFGEKTYNKMIQNLFWAAGYNAFAIPLAAGVGYSFGIMLSPAFGAALMSLSTVIVAFNAQLLKLKK